MKRAILSTDENPDYIQFLPLVAKAWTNFGFHPTIGVFGNATVNSMCGDIIRFTSIDGVPDWFSAQNIRLLIPTLFPNDTCLISDIDLLPLNGNYYIERIVSASNGNIIIYSSDAYNSLDRYPICYLAGKGSVFEEIITSDIGLTTHNFPQIIREWHNMDLGWSTDEILFTKMLHTWDGYPKRTVKFARGGWDPFAGRRIDRANWKFDKKLLYEDYYIDAHLLRPFPKYFAEIIPLIDYLRIPRSELPEIKWHQWLYADLKNSSLYNMFRQTKLASRFRQFYCQISK